MRNGKNTIPSSLYAGQLGFALPLAIHYKTFGDDKSLQALESLLEYEINRCTPMDTSLCTGLSGLGWTLSFLENSGVISLEKTSSFHKLDEYLMNRSLSQIRKGNYDLLDGGLGIAVYFLEREITAEIKTYFISLVVALDEKKVLQPNGGVWNSSLDPSKWEVNLGIAHGLPSIIIILSKMQQAGVGTQLGRKLIESAVNWLLANKSIEDYCLYPSVIDDEEDDPFSRLAWCYGDLSVAKCLLAAGRALHKDDWVRESRLTAEHTLVRRTEESTGVSDPCICHGSSGLAYMYYRNYVEYGDLQFLDAANYWSEKTWRYRRVDEGVCGFKFWMMSENKWVDSPGLLEGTTGILLSQMSIQSNVDFAWGKCLLIE